MKVISGGQTGVDRAALDAAMEAGMEHGGSVPRGRRAEDGPIDPRYSGLTELADRGYRRRTERNVVDADATLVFTFGRPEGGTGFTLSCIRKHGRPFLIVDLEGTGDEAAVASISAWLRQTNPSVLNVAGPRESTAPGGYRRVFRILSALLRRVSRRP